MRTWGAPAARKLVRDPRVVVTGLDGYECQQTRANLAHDLVIDADIGFRDALDQQDHSTIPMIQPTFC